MRSSFFKNKLREPLLPDWIQEKESGVDRCFSGVLPKDSDVLKQLFSYGVNIDFLIREIFLPSTKQKAMLFFVPSLSDANRIDEEIIKPLIKGDKPVSDVSSALSISSIKEEKEILKAVEDISVGDTLLLIEGVTKGFLLKTSKVAGRSVDKPQNETTLLGPKEAFNEKADTNISLLRKKVHSSDFVVEKLVIGSRSKNEVFLVYNKELVGEPLLSEVKQRINGIKKDAVQNLSLLVQYIEDKKRSLFPTVLETERPDRAVSFIEDGYIAVVMNNSPSALILPATFWSFFHSGDDHYLRFFYGNFTRLLRMIAMFITLFTPSIYIAITNYHLEMLPTDLLLAIAGAREKVPFPAIIELLIMEMSFELIREAGIRVPQPIGPTIGIVGALILGQAAVQANVVSPIVVIVVALTGLASFAIADVNLNYAIRIARFIFLFAASVLGIFGMVSCFLAGLFYISVVKSFGVPYLAPLTPNYKSSADTLFRKLLKNENLRPGYVKSRDLTKEPTENK